MQRSTLLTFSWLNILSKERYNALCTHFGSLDKALSELDEAVLKELGCRNDTILRTLNRLEEFDPAAYEKELTKRGLAVLSLEDEQYPRALRHIGDPPVFLMYRGDLSLTEQPCLAIVGTREMSSYGKRVTQTMVPDVVRAGMITVSGLAYGIDREVAEETLHAEGKTIAVLGHGLAMIHPRQHAQLAEDIVEQGGLLLSEYALDEQPNQYTFPARNRIIAGLSLATVVIEAGKQSGSLITADLALEYGRDVFAVPGDIFDPTFEGSHALIAGSRAKLVTSAQDILRELGVVAPETRTKDPDAAFDSMEEELLYHALTTMPQSPDDLSTKIKLDAAIMSATLTVLELKGLVKNVGGGRWVKN